MKLVGVEFEDTIWDPVPDGIFSLGNVFELCAIFVERDETCSERSTEVIRWQSESGGFINHEASGEPPLR